MSSYLLKIFFVFQLVLVLNFASAQENKKADSLTNLLTTSIADTTRLTVLTELANIELQNKSQFKKAQLHAEEGLKFAMEKNLSVPYKLHWAMAKINIHLKEYDKAIEQIEIVLIKLKSLNNPIEIAKAQNYLGWVYLEAGDFTKCLNNFEKNIEYASHNEISTIIPEAYNGIAYVYSYLKNKEEEKRTLYMMLEASRQENNTKSEAEAYFRLGNFGMIKDSNFVFAIEKINL